MSSIQIVVIPSFVVISNVGIKKSHSPVFVGVGRGFCSFTISVFLGLLH